MRLEDDRILAIMKGTGCPHELAVIRSERHNLSVLLPVPQDHILRMILFVKKSCQQKDSNLLC